MRDVSEVGPVTRRVCTSCARSMTCWRKLSRVEKKLDRLKMFQPLMLGRPPESREKSPPSHLPSASHAPSENPPDVVAALHPRLPVGSGPAAMFNPGQAMRVVSSRATHLPTTASSI